MLEEVPTVEATMSKRARSIMYGATDIAVATLGTVVSPLCLDRAGPLFLDRPGALAAVT